MRYLLILIVFALTVASCSQDQSHDGNSLLKIHAQQREFHLAKNAKGMVDGFADNLITVNRGVIDSVLNREEDSVRFQRYFDAVKFKKWDDESAPIIRFSEDHSLAYMIVSKVVVLETINAADSLIEETTHFAWVSIFRKQRNGEWKLECISSTNQPSVER